jgi:hypothetical protein
VEKNVSGRVKALERKEKLTFSGANYFTVSTCVKTVSTCIGDKSVMVF